MKIIKIKSGEKIPPFSQILNQSSVFEQEGDFGSHVHYIELLVPEEKDWEFMAQKCEQYKKKKKKD